MRQLLAMHDGRQRAWWDHDAWICHVIANSNRDPDSTPITPAECNPLEIQQGTSGRGGLELTPEVVRAVARGLKARREGR